MSNISPDDLCQVCQTPRDQHGDKHHKFSVDGQLIQLDPPKPRQEAPRHRDEKPAAPEAKAFATLIEVLAEKNILNTKDVIRIFSGQG